MPPRFNRAQLRKADHLKTMEQLKARAYADGKSAGITEGIARERERVTVLVPTNDYGFADLTRVPVSVDRWRCQVAPPNHRVGFYNPLVPSLTYEFEARPMRIDLPNGASAGWYAWELVGHV